MTVKLAWRFRKDGFRIIYWNPVRFCGLFSSIIKERAARNLVAIVGQFYTGKTEIIRQVRQKTNCLVCREVKSRQLRANEIQGEFHISMPEDKIIKAIDAREMVLVYEADHKGNRQIAGISVEEFRRCFEENDCLTLINTHPEAALILYEALKQMRIFVIWASDKDIRKFRAMRSDKKNNYSQNITGAWHDDISLPGHSTWYVRNRFGRPESATRKIVKRLVAP